MASRVLSLALGCLAAVALACAVPFVGCAIGDAITAVLSSSLL